MTLVAILTVRREALERFRAFERHAATVMARHGGRIERTVVVSPEGSPDLVKEVFGKEPGLFNNVGQHYNHVHFWNWMKPNGGGGASKVPGALLKAIDSDLGGYDKFRADFINAGTTQFGSGWAWLSLKNGKLEVSKTANGESPLVHGNAHPLLGVDVWEHSYYIDYRNARPKYLEAWFDNLVNWEHVAKMYDEAK